MGEPFTASPYKKELTEATSNEITRCQVQKTQQKEGVLFSIWAPVRLWNSLPKDAVGTRGLQG